MSGFHEERSALLRRQARLHLPVWAAGYPGAACHILCDHPPWPDRFSDGGLPRCRLPRRLKPSALAGPALGSDRQLRPCRAHTSPLEAIPMRCVSDTSLSKAVNEYHGFDPGRGNRDCSAVPLIDTWLSELPPRRCHSWGLYVRDDWNMTNDGPVPGQHRLCLCPCLRRSDWTTLGAILAVVSGGGWGWARHD